MLIRWPSRTRWVASPGAGELEDGIETRTLPRRQRFTAPLLGALSLCDQGAMVAGRRSLGKPQLPRRRTDPVDALDGMGFRRGTDRDVLASEGWGQALPRSGPGAKPGGLSAGEAPGPMLR
jgi:hypothetical protein